MYEVLVDLISCFVFTTSGETNSPGSTLGCDMCRFMVLYDYDDQTRSVILSVSRCGPKE